MTNYVFSQPLAAQPNDTFVTLQAFDRAVLLSGATIVAGDAFLTGIVLNGANALEIGSQIYGAGTAVRVSGNSSSVHVLASGVVHGNLAAIMVESGENSILNDGSIASFGTSPAIRILGNGQTLVANTGSIAGAKAIECDETNAGQSLRLVNSGTVITHGLAVAGSGGGDEIWNSGLIHSSSAQGMDLKDGNDAYNGASGILIGRLLLGAGNDSAVGGIQGEVFEGGSGDDLLDGGGGVDTTVYTQGDITVDLRSTGWQNTGEGFDRLVNIENVTSGGGNDRLVGNDIDNALTGNGGNDTLEGGLGDDVLNGGTHGAEGGDTARYTGTAAAVVTLTLQGQRQNTTGYGFDTLLGIENLEGGSGNDVFVGDDDANRLSGNGGNDALTGGKGNDILDGGTGQNTAVFSGAQAEYTVSPDGGVITVADGQGGRDGTDVLTNVRFLQFSDRTVALFNASPDSLSLSSMAVAEDTLVNSTVATLSARDADGDPLTYTLLSSADGTFRLDGNALILAKALDYDLGARQQTITIEAKDAYGGTTTRTFTLAVTNVIETTGLTLIGTAGVDTLRGEAGNDVISGLAGNDSLFGEAGNDILRGAAGHDVLSGGAGQDVFIFDSRPNRRANLDRISDFSVADDTIHLVKSVFSKINKTGVLAKGAFHAGGAAHDRDDRIIYNKNTGAVYYDDDGTGAHAQVQIAALAKNLALANTDFFIV
jgi:Ca2+-binding RTX toxin-like protein